MSKNCKTCEYWCLRDYGWGVCEAGLGESWSVPDWSCGYWYQKESIHD